MEHAICLFCGGNRDEPDHLSRCDGRQGRIEADQRPENEPADLDPRDVPGNRSYREELAKLKGWDD